MGYRYYSITSAVLVTTNLLIGAFAAPTGIWFTAILLPVLALCVCVIPTELAPQYTSLSLYLFSALNDLGLKLWAGGTHDWEGQGWIHGFLIIGSLLATVVLLVHFVLEKEYHFAHKLLALMLYPLLILLHLHIFQTFGV